MRRAVSGLGARPLLLTYSLALSLALSIGACVPQSPRAGTVHSSATVTLAARAAIPEGRTLMGWTADSWQQEEVFGPLLRETSRAGGAIIAVAPEVEVEDIEALARRWGANLDRIAYLHVGLDTFWMRDFGPQVQSRGGRPDRIIDLDYGGVRVHDDALPWHFARWLGLPHQDFPFFLEGGHLLRDGEGMCLTTDVAVTENISRGANQARFLAGLRDYFSCEQTLVLPALVGETTGHVDMFASFAGPGRVILGSYPVAEDPLNATRLDEAADILAGAGLEVLRIPMPARMMATDPFPTYTNLVALEHVVLVPVYRGNSLREAMALLVLQSAFEGRRIVPVPGEGLTALEGGLHCVTMELPPSITPGGPYDGKDLPVRQPPEGIQSLLELPPIEDGEEPFSHEPPERDDDPEEEMEIISEP